MPLVEIRNVIRERYLAIWQISESESELLSQLQPSPEDSELLQSYRHQNKRLEWLAGRISLKKLCTEVGLDYNGISKTKEGKPVLNGLKPEISLSHSYPMVAAIMDLNELEVGVDIEQKRLKVLQLKKKFMTQNELNDIGPEDFTKATLIWSAKETLYKIYAKKRLEFKSDLEIAPFEIDYDNKNGILDAQITKGLTKLKYKIAYSITPGYVLTYNL